MGFLSELEEEYRKKGMFNSDECPISYPIGFPILDENLGGIYRRKLPDGTYYEMVRVGVPAGTITQFGGDSSTGKTTAAIQAAWNIIEPFEDAVVIHFDEERATDYERVVAVTGADPEDVANRYEIVKPPNTFSSIQKYLNAVCEKKEANKDKMMYHTGVYDMRGKEIIHYIPTVFIIDSMMTITSDNEDTTEISGLTSAGRETIYRNKLLRNMLKVIGKYNINVFFINHTGNDMDLGKPGGGSKQLTFIETGKKLPGGDKSIAWSTSIIIFKPVNSKDQIKHEDEEGYNGVPIRAMVVKSRSSSGGWIAQQEFVQEYGFDPRLTLMNFAKEKGLISGRNPGCYFTCNPDVKFDTRRFVEEMDRDPRIVDMLAEQCEPELRKLIRVYDLTGEDTTGNSISSMNQKKGFRNRIRNMYNRVTK